MSTPSAASLRGLYRDLLRTVRTFPSRKRVALREDIRVEFRLGARLTDAAAVAHAVEVATRGLDTMRKYTSLNPRASHWTVDLEPAPLGAPPASAPAGQFVTDPAVTVRQL